LDAGSRWTGWTSIQAKGNGGIDKIMPALYYIIFFGSVLACDKLS